MSTLEPGPQFHQPGSVLLSEEPYYTLLRQAARSDGGGERDRPLDGLNVAGDPSISIAKKTGQVRVRLDRRHRVAAFDGARNNTWKVSQRNGLLDARRVHDLQYGV